MTFRGFSQKDAHFGKALAVYAREAGTDLDEGRRAKADFQTRRALKLALNNDEVKKLRAEVVKHIAMETPDSLRNPRIASGGQSVYHERMSEDEIGEIRDELKAYKEKLDELREDFKFFLMHDFEATNRIIEKANQRGNLRYNQPVVERCRKYLDKYAIGGAY